MGYDVHITRRQDWWDKSSGSDITLAEWKSYIDKDPSMCLEGYAETTTPSGEVIRFESEGLAVWTRPAERVGDRDSGEVWFDYHDGRIVVTNPDPGMLQKMHSFTSRLGARVQGDEGEEYDQHGQVSDR